MNTILKLTVAAAALTGLTACDALGIGGGNAGGNNSVAAATTNNTAAPADANSSAGKDPAAGGNVATASTTPSAPGQVTREFLIGRWTDNNDCNNTITFNADGNFTVPGGGSGIWVLDGDRLTFQGERAVSARIQAPDSNTIMLIHDDGSVGRSTRCS